MMLIQPGAPIIAVSPYGFGPPTAVTVIGNIDAVRAIFCSGVGKEQLITIATDFFNGHGLALSVPGNARHKAYRAHNIPVTPIG